MLGTAALASVVLAVAPALVLGPGPVAAQAPDAATDDGSVLVAEDLLDAAGPVDVVVQLDGLPLAALAPAEAKSAGDFPSSAAGQARRDEIAAEQATVASALASLGAEERVLLGTALDALVVTVDAGAIGAIADLPSVRSVRRVQDYHLHQEAPVAADGLDRAAAHIGATAVRAAGTDGTGVRVAVLDTGIDYTHANLGGPGSRAAYLACYGDADTQRHAQVPVGECATYLGPEAPKVKGGYDFVGESWPGRPDTLGGPIVAAREAPDANPLDANGHGTHVADIIGGRSADAVHLGIAPGADLYAVKVCSSVAARCSGLAVLQGVDYALDPNGDADLSDAVDVMNLAFGDDEGTGADDLADALATAARFGVVVVTSAGNGGDHPYGVGGAGAGAGVLSVAQTAGLGESWLPVTIVSPPTPSIPANTVTNSVVQPWAPVVAPVTGRAVVPVPATGCSPSEYGEVAIGAVAVVRRGICTVSTKSDAARQAGAVAVVVVNNVDGLAPTFAYGGGTAVPTVATNQHYGELLLSAAQANEVQVALDPAVTVPLVGTVAQGSARGPAPAGSALKPDLAAPGAWRSAQVATGDGETAFGGTSGAAATVAGAAVLLLHHDPTAPASEVAARLVNAADTGVRLAAVDGSFAPAPVSRVGGGELRVDRALLAAPVTVRAADGGAGLSFGAVDVAGTKTVSRRVIVTNPTATAQTYLLSAGQRGAEASVAPPATLLGPSTVTVGPYATAEITVRLQLDPAALPRWPLAGYAGGRGRQATPSPPEIDGYLVLTPAPGSGPGEIHLPWHVLPRRSSALSLAGSACIGTQGTTKLKVRNLSVVGDGVLDVFALTGASEPRVAEAATAGAMGELDGLDGKADLAAVGVRSDDKAVQFAIATYGRRATPSTSTRFEIAIDTTGDARPDYLVYNGAPVGPALGAASGRDVVYVQAVGADVASAQYTSIADFNSATVVLTVPRSALGLDPLAAQATTLSFSVRAIERSSGLVGDAIDANQYTMDSPRYAIAEGYALAVAPATTARFTLAATGSTAPSSERGLLLLTTADALSDFHVVTVAS